MLVYFNTVASKYAPTSQWLMYSMLKSVIKIRENIDISKFFMVNATMKKVAQYYVPKKAEIFTQEEVMMFLEEASDDFYLVHKVSKIWITLYVWFFLLI